MGNDLDFYPDPPVGQDENGLFPTASIRKEIDLRQELKDILYGSASLLPHGQLGLLRRMRKDDAGKLIPCPCVDPLTGEGDRDYLCPVCLGESYLWDEEYITFYKTEVAGREVAFAGKEIKHQGGILNVKTILFYMEWFVNPTEHDRIIELELGLDGAPLNPIKRKQVNVITTAQDYRSDFGRVEYFRCATYEDEVKSGWQLKS